MTTTPQSHLGKPAAFMPLTNPTRMLALIPSPDSLWQAAAHGRVLPGEEKRSLAAKWLGKVMELLSRAPSQCLLCRKPFRPGNPNSQGVYATTSLPPESFPRVWQESLCKPCRDSIPWINKISCAVCGRSTPCRDCCRRTAGGLIRNRSTVEYNPAMKELLARYKYKGDEALLPLLGAMLLPAYAQLIMEIRRAQAGQRSSGPPFDAITFVPVSQERLKERGFNQAERLASQLGLCTGLPVLDLLFRVEERGKMSMKSRQQRLEASESLFQALPECTYMLRKIFNAAPSVDDQNDRQKSGGKFRFGNRKNAAQAAAGSSLFSAVSASPRPLRILIVDDIYTTGGTLDGCSRALHASTVIPLDIRAITWARA